MPGVYERDYLDQLRGSRMENGTEPWARRPRSGGLERVSQGGTIMSELAGRNPRLLTVKYGVGQRRPMTLDELREVLVRAGCTAISISRKGDGYVAAGWVAPPPGVPALRMEIEAPPGATRDAAAGLLLLAVWAVMGLKFSAVATGNQRIAVRSLSNLRGDQVDEVVPERGAAARHARRGGSFAAVCGVRHQAHDEQRKGPVMANRIPIQEVVATAGVSRSTIDRWRRRGLLDSYRSPGVDRRVYIDVDQLLELRRNPPLERLEPRRSEDA